MARSTSLVLTLVFVCFFIKKGHTQPAPNCAGFSFEDINNTPIATVKMRFHFLPRKDKQANFSREEAVRIAKNMVDYSNQNLSNLNPVSILGPKGIKPAHVKDSRLRLRLYSESNDGGVVIHPEGTEDLPSDRYGERVVNIAFVYCYDKNEKGDTISCCYNQAMGNNRIDFCNVWKVLATDTAIQKNRSRLLVHELGHILSLSHTFTCGNECENVDIDPIAECGGQCEWEGHVCKSRGNNIMSYRHGNGDDYNTALTPCQWEKIFNHIEQTHPLSIQFDCAKETEPLVIEANETWNNLTLMNRDIIVERGVKLTLNCEVRFTEGCKIYVRRRGQLVVNAKMTNLCNGSKWSAAEGKGKISFFLN